MLLHIVYALKLSTFKSIRSVISSQTVTREIGVLVMEASECITNIPSVETSSTSLLLLIDKLKFFSILCLDKKYFCTNGY